MIQFMMNTKSPELYYLALSKIQLPLWLKSKLLLLVDFKIERLWQDWNGDLIQFIQFKERIQEFKDWDSLKRIEETIHKKNIKLILANSQNYPELLKNTCDFPILLFCRGDYSLLKHDSLAVVGTRTISPYGLAVVTRFIPKLVQAGFCIVSGMARGVDSIAHQLTLKNKGKTIAVLGSGIDKPSPAENSKVYDKILQENGLIISEFLPGTPGFKQNYPQRNRIVAGLSRGTLVIEAGYRSGSLITADISNSYSRDVFSVPGPITSQLSSGVNTLIKKGAIVTTEPEDILLHYNLLIKESINDVKLQAKQLEFLKLIDPQGSSLNDILSKSADNLTQVLKNLDELERTRCINKDEFGIYYLN